MMTRDQLEKVLEALQEASGYAQEGGYSVRKDCAEAIAILQAALEEPSEPVALIDGNNEHIYFPTDAMYHYWIGRNCTPLFTHPAPLPELTDEEMFAAFNSVRVMRGWAFTDPQREFARAILAAAREKK